MSNINELPEKPSYEELEERVRELEEKLARVCARQDPGAGEWENALGPDTYKALFDYTKNAVAVYRVVGRGEDFIFEDFNLAAEKIENISREELIGKSVMAVFPGVKAFGLIEVLRRVWKTGTPERFPLSFYEDDRIVGWRDNYVYRLPTGRMAAVYTDETKRKKNEAFLSLFQMALETASDAIGMATPEGRHFYQNTAFTKLFGDVGEDPSSRVFADEEKGREIFRTIMAGGQWVGEVKMFGKDGEMLDVLLRAYSIEDTTGRLVGLVGVHTDITRRKEEERALVRHRDRLQEMVEARTRDLEKAKIAAEKANHTKSSFLAGISHELRTPLNAVIGFSEILEDETFGPLLPKQKEYIGHIHESGNLLLELINDLLDIAKIEAGKMDLDLRLHPVSDLLAACLGVFKKPIAEKRLMVSLHICESVTRTGVWMDELRIKQVVLNLLSNAVKFTPEAGSIDIRVSDADDRTVFCVADNGIGVSAEDARMLFDDFYQSRRTREKGLAGTGLGLPLAKRIVEIHGGDIWLESPGPGRGATFCFTLPRR